jgi:hypothetical protein
MNYLPFIMLGVLLNAAAQLFFKEVRHRPRFVIRTVYEKIDTEKEGTHD